MQKSLEYQFSVDIIIPNWNGKHLLEKNIPYVISNAPGAGIIVCDDASTDGSIDWLRRHYPNVRITEASSQKGFAQNVNSGVSESGADVIVLLNTDVTPKKNFLIPLLAHFSDSEVFAVGCLEESYEAGGIVLRGRGLAKWERGYFVHRRGNIDKTDTAWVSGGSAAFKREIWNQLGGMDRVFNPFYWEDIDLSYRAQKAGYKVIFEPKSKVEHRHMEGKIKTSYTPNQVKKIAYRNQYLFIWKNLSEPSIWLSHVIWVPIRLLQSLLRGDWQHLGGFLLALLLIPTIIPMRKKIAKHWKLSDYHVVS